MGPRKLASHEACGQELILYPGWTGRARSRATDLRTRTSRVEVGVRQGHVEPDANMADTQRCAQTSRGDTEAAGFVRAHFDRCFGDDMFDYFSEEDEGFNKRAPVQNPQALAGVLRAEGQACLLIMTSCQ